MMMISLLCTVLLIGAVMFPETVYGGQVNTWDELLALIRSGKTTISQVEPYLSQKVNTWQDVQRCIPDAPANYEDFSLMINMAIEQGNQANAGEPDPGESGGPTPNGITMDKVLAQIRGGKTTLEKLSSFFPKSINTWEDVFRQIVDAPLDYSEFLTMINVAIEQGEQAGTGEAGVGSWNDFLALVRGGKTELADVAPYFSISINTWRDVYDNVPGAPSDYDSFLVAVNNAIAEANKPGFGGALPGSGLDSTSWAAKGQAKLYNSTGILVGWTAKLGLLVAFYGAIKLGLAFVQDDAGEKVVGLTAMVSGFMVWSVSMSVNKLFL